MTGRRRSLSRSKGGPSSSRATPPTSRSRARATRRRRRPPYGKSLLRADALKVTLISGGGRREDNDPEPDFDDMDDDYADTYEVDSYDDMEDDFY